MTFAGADKASAMNTSMDGGSPSVLGIGSRTPSRHDDLSEEGETVDDNLPKKPMSIALSSFGNVSNYYQ